MSRTTGGRKHKDAANSAASSGAAARGKAGMLQMDATAGRPTSSSTVAELGDQPTSTASSTATVRQHGTGTSGRREFASLCQCGGEEASGEQ